MRGKETILLVEDEPNVRKVIQEMLAREGYNVLGACDAQEAQEVRRRHKGRIDLLITDIVMPGMNGFQLAQHLRSELRGLKVLYISGFTQEAILRTQGVSLEGAPFLLKPFVRETLARKVREALESPIPGRNQTS